MNDTNSADSGESLPPEIQRVIEAAHAANLVPDSTIPIPPIGPLLDKWRLGHELAPSKILPFPASDASASLTLAARAAGAISVETRAKLAQLVREMSSRDHGQ